MMRGTIAFRPAAPHQGSVPGKPDPFLTGARRSAAPLVLLCLIAMSGCSSHVNRIRAARDQFYAGDLRGSAEQLTDQLQRYPRDADASSLDLAMVELAGGQPAEAERRLRQVRDNFDYLEQPDAIESGASLLTDDQRRAYAGSSYEKVLTRVFLALTNLLNDGQDAEAYSLQINAKQEELLRKVADEGGGEGQLAAPPLAIGPYLRGVIRESTYGNYDDAARAYHQVVSWQPAFQAGKVDLQRAEQGVHSRPGHGVLYVFGLVNRGPFKEEAIEVPTSQALLVADRILSVMGKYDLPPTIAPIKIPRVMVPPREVDHLAVMVDGRQTGATEVICDVADLALRQEAIELPGIMARAVVRRVVKKAAVYATKDAVQVDSTWADLALSAAGVVWEATEAADTRCWGLLPREIQVLRVELPIGRHQLQLVPAAAGRPLASAATVTVDIEDGRNTYLLANFPGPHLVGQILQRTP